jgi:hypothetical protein
VLARRAGEASAARALLRDVVRAQARTLYPDVVAEVRRELGMDATRAVMEELVGQVEHRIDRLYRELARKDARLSFLDEDGT